MRSLIALCVAATTAFVSAPANAQSAGWLNEPYLLERAITFTRATHIAANACEDPFRGDQDVQNVHAILSSSLTDEDYEMRIGLALTNGDPRAVYDTLPPAFKVIACVKATRYVQDTVALFKQRYPHLMRMRLEPRLR
ncbi:MAG: hypothetical protein K2X45_08015 [Phreatobacter sp.]|nr:hypothetical protein [Phreatobacter sp.]